jgi:hypothetical protein
MLLAIVCLVPIALGLILKGTQTFPNTVKTLAEVGSFVALAFTWTTLQIHRGIGVVNRLLEIQAKAEKARANREKPPEVMLAENSLDDCRKIEAEAEYALKNAEATVHTLECELKDLVPGRRLFRFLEDRAGANDYRRHLGLVRSRALEEVYDWNWNVVPVDAMESVPFTGSPAPLDIAPCS